jgi:serine/threonine protein kinase/tetratricopeptide (TPR) repeat protein
MGAGRQTIDPVAAVDSGLARIVDELTARLRAGGSVTAGDLAAEFPEYADRLGRLLPAMALLAEVSRTAGEQPEGIGSPAAAAEPVPGVLGDFRIVREVGRGGMGVVYEAEQESLNRRVALKVLPFAATMDPKQLQRFHNEAKAAASLYHEHIVQVHGVGCERGVHFFAMRFIDGHTLADVIAVNQTRRRHRGADRAPDASIGAPACDATGGDTAAIALLSTEPTDPRRCEFFRRCAELIADAADALEHAHSLGIVHRDIKPGNLMVDRLGKVWVTDFGLARFGPDAGLTMTGDLLGTLRYMAPEQALAKHGLVDHRADVYGLGATLYELLTGQPAVGGEDKQEILKRIAFEEPVALRKLARSIPVELETITLKCLAKEPTERYATAGELAADLRRFVGDRPVQAKPPSLPRRLARLARRHSGAVAAAAVAAGVAFIALAASTVVVIRQRDQVESALGQAKTNLATAEAERERARQVVEDMYTQVAEKWLAHQPRLQPLQREFLEKALRHYQEIAGGSNRRDRLDLGRCYFRVGQIQTNFGDNAKAMQAYRQAAAVLEPSTAEQPGDPKTWDQLASAWCGLGLVLVRTGDNRGAEVACRRAIAARERLITEGVTTADNRASLAVCYGTLGHALERTAGPAAAEPAYRSAIRIEEELVGQTPANAGRQMALAASFQDLAAALYAAQKFQRVRETLEQGIRHAELAVKGAPAEADYRAKLALLRMSLGVVYCKTNQLPAAEQSLGAARDLQSRLADEYPDFPRYREDLAGTYNVLGNVYDESGRPKEAEAAYRESIRIKDRLAADNPAVPYYRLDLVQSLNNLTSLLIKPVRLAEAERTNAEARRQADRLVKDFPGVADHQKCLARAHQRRADIDLAAGRPADAAAEWEQALAASDDPDIRDGAAEFLAGCPDPKVRDPKRAVELARENTRLAPENYGYWETLGLAEYRAGHAAEAVAAFEQAVRVGSTEPLARLLLAMARRQAGDTERAPREYEAARSQIEKAGKPDEGTRALLAEAATLFGVADGGGKTGQKATPVSSR